MFQYKQLLVQLRNGLKRCNFLFLFSFYLFFFLRDGEFLSKATSKEKKDNRKVPLFNGAQINLNFFMLTYPTVELARKDDGRSDQQSCGVCKTSFSKRFQHGRVSD